MRAPFSGHVRPRALSVILRGVRQPWPDPGALVDVDLGHGVIVKGRMRMRLGMDVFRVELTDRVGDRLGS